MAQITLKHRFTKTCLDPEKLLRNVTKVSQFMSNLNKMASEQEGNGNGWTADEFKGDGFEALCECMLLTNETDKRLNITGYTPNLDEDMGVDGLGYTNSVKDRRPVTVQMKFRSDTNSYLTTDDKVSNFVANTLVTEGFEDAEMVIITTAKGLHRTVEEKMFRKRVRTIGYKALREVLDDNPAFWNTFRKALTV